MTKKGLRHCSFRCPSGLLCIFKMFASFFFLLLKWLALHFRNVCIIFLFVAQMGFFGTSGGQLGFWLEGLGAQLGILWDPSRLGSFGGPSFLGFWEHPKVKFSKSRPCFKSIWVFYILVLGFTASCSIVPWIKFNSIEWDFYFYLGFYFCKLFDFFFITFEV